jgi:hypothetical protein
MKKVRHFFALDGAPVISLGLGEHPYLVGAEAYTWSGSHWVKAASIGRLIIYASEIGAAAFARMYPTAAKAARWLPRTEAVQDPEDAMLDRVIAALEELKERRTQDAF